MQKSSAMARIEVRGLGKVYPTGTVALEAVDLSIADGEFVSILGPSGCGKSTLLRIMAGLDAATAGDVRIDAAARNGDAGLPAAFVFQEQSLFPWMRVRENVAFGFDGMRVPRERVRSRVDEMLALVGLEAFAGAHPHELSGGMKQRVAVARAFAVDAPVLFMDEPFGALDEQTRVQIGAELLGLWERARKTVAFVTHSIDEAVALSDRIVVLSARPGRVREIVTVDLPRPRDPIALRGDPRFAALVVRLWELLR